MIVRPDQQPGFWNEYKPPSAVAEIIQRPLYMIEKVSAEELIAAYMNDFWNRTKRKPK